MKTFEKRPMEPRIDVCSRYWNNECRGCPLAMICGAPMQRPYGLNEIYARIDEQNRQAIAWLEKE